MPFAGPHGPHAGVKWYPLTAGAVFQEGEPCLLLDAGTVDDVATPVTSNDDIVGFAAGTGDTTDATGLGSFRVNGFGQFTPGTGAAATNDWIPVYAADNTSEYITANFTEAGAAFGDVAPAQAHLNRDVGLIEIGDDWGINVAGAAPTFVARITRVLDADGVDVTLSGAAGVFVVFALLAHQMVADAGVVNVGP